ncbi:MAG: cytochrome c oxidase subunit 3 [Bacteroidia bacterium]
MADVVVDKKALIEGERPMFNASYGKLMMWYFLVSDALTFSGLLIAYGALRVRAGSQGLSWANPEEVFTHTPFLYELWHIEAPLVFVGIMTFILILSSVTMVLAVEAGHRKSKQEVAKWVFLTILGGATFLGCQAYEWYHFIHGTDHGAVILKPDELAGVNLPADAFDDPHGLAVFPVMGLAATEGGAKTVTELRLRDGYRISDPGVIRTVTDILANPEANEARFTHGGANMLANEYGPPAFANLFFFVTGFHGTHVFSGVVLLIILLLNVQKGTYERRGHYEMTEKIGLYWHFVDLVWVFVFTFFYLV